MDFDDDDSEQGVLSYSEFVRRETLHAWVERKRASEGTDLPRDGQRAARDQGSVGQSWGRS
jgi:hypothetical protein